MKTVVNSKSNIGKVSIGLYMYIVETISISNCAIAYKWNPARLSFHIKRTPLKEMICKRPEMIK
jgi:hypothetical protein